MSVLKKNKCRPSISILGLTYPAHVSSLHELEVLDLAKLEPDRVHVLLEIPGGHVVQALCVLIPFTDVIPLRGIWITNLILKLTESFKPTNIVIVVVIYRVMCCDLKPQHLLGPGGHPVVEADLVVAVRVRLL